jgi:hypothetical protein
MKTKFGVSCITSLIFILSLLVSCSSQSEPQEIIIEEPEKETPTISQTCDENSDFPNLGPSASQSQSCDDVIDPNNKGTLDCRTDQAVGGYENLADGWGSYKITGGVIRYDGTQTRVERFFKTISQGTSKKTILSGKLKIVDLSDANTCIVQSHAGGAIIKGEEQGSTNRSAQFLVYAMKTTDNKVKLETHVTINPYTTDTGGARDRQEFKTLNYNQDYDFIYETGYDDSGVAFSRIKVGDTEKYITHNHTTERVYSRYGAYGASDTGDVTAHVEFKDISLCRE